MAFGFKEQLQNVNPDLSEEELERRRILDERSKRQRALKHEIREQIDQLQVGDMLVTKKKYRHGYREFPAGTRLIVKAIEVVKNPKRKILIRLKEFIDIPEEWMDGEESQTPIKYDVEITHLLLAEKRSFFDIHFQRDNQ